MSLHRWLLEREDEVFASCDPIEPSVVEVITRRRGREFYGPAAIPIAALAVSLFGVGESISNSNQANKQYQAQTANQAQAQAGEVAAANKLEAPTPLQPLLDAQKGGVESFLSSAGGVPNIGALAKSLFGDTISKALGAVLSQDAANTAEAGQLYGNAATGYGSAATSAGKNASGLASGIGSGITGVLSGINGLKPKSPGVATGPGTSGQSDITVPSPGDTSGLDIPSGPAGFGGQDVPDLVTA